MFSSLNDFWKAAAVALLALATLLPTGCGKGGTKVGGEGNDKWAEQQSAIRKKAEEEEALAEKRMREEAEQRRRNPTPTPPPSTIGATVTAIRPHPADGDKPTPAPRLDRPPEFLAWKPTHYVDALREHDSRLMAAIQYLGAASKQGKNAEANIAILEQLLDIASMDNALPVVGSDDDDRPRVGSMNLKIGEAAIETLAAIGTPPARRILCRIAAGKLPNQQLSLAALKAVLQRSSAETEDLVVEILSRMPSREKTATASADAVARAATLKHAREQASQALRMRLARLAVRPETTEALFRELWDCLKEHRTDNLRAQIVVYECRRLDVAATEELETSFAAHSRAALAKVLCISVAPQETDTIDPGIAAECLWQPEFLATIEQRMRVQDETDRNHNLLLLATTIPSPIVRTNLFCTLEKHWEEGPQLLNALKRNNGLVDPALRLLVKQLLPKNNERLATNGKNAKALAAAREIKLRQEGLTKQWQASCENLVHGMCQQFFRVARLQRMEPGVGRVETLNAHLGFKLRPETVVVVNHIVEWPQGLDKKLEHLRLPPLKLCYARVEHRAQPAKLLAYYRRQLPSCEQRLNEQRAWLEGAKKDAEGRYIESIDVLISKPSKETTMLADQDQPLVADILVIHCGNERDKEVKSGGASGEPR